MNELFQRRRGLMAGKGDGWTTVTGLSWALGKNINNTGQKPEAAFAAYSSPVMVAGATVERTGSSADGNGTPVYCYLHEYKGTGSDLSSNWLRRTSMAVGAKVTVGQDCTNFRFTFAYASTAGKTMTQTVIENCFGAKYKV